MRLKVRTYTYRELKEIENAIKTGPLNIDFLIDNLVALRILGYILVLPKKLSCQHAFYDVLKFNADLPQNKAILYRSRNDNR